MSLRITNDAAVPISAGVDAGDQRASRRIAGSWRWLFTAVLLALVLRLLDWSTLLELLGSANPLLLALAFLVAVADRVLMFGKWFPLLRAQVPDFPLGRAGRGYFAASVGIILLPASGGADLLRAVGLGRRSGQVARLAASVVAERILGLAATGVAAAVALALAPVAGLDIYGRGTWIGLIALLSGLALILPVTEWGPRVVERFFARYRHHRLGESLHRFSVACAVYRKHKPVWYAVWLLSIIEQFVPVVMLWLVALSLGVAVPFVALLVTVPLTMLAVRLPITMAGLGVFEGGLVYLLGHLGTDPTHALAIALGSRVVGFAVLLPGVVWWRELTHGRES
jgi:uncharacterized protein (TIRG00374 family)